MRAIPGDAGRVTQMLTNWGTHTHRNTEKQIFTHENSHTFILVNVHNAHTDWGKYIQTHTHKPWLRKRKREGNLHTHAHLYIGILYLCPHPNRKQGDINIKDAISYEALRLTSNRSFFFTVYSCQSELALNKTGYQGCFLLIDRFLNSKLCETSNLIDN